MKIILKKIISLAMIIFIMSASLTAIAAEDAAAPVVENALTEAQIEKYNIELGFLKAMGIWRSPETDPVAKVTRGEFASAIAGLCNLSNATALKYTDVNEETQFVNDIYAVGWANLMVGSDSMFRPEDELTYNQAAKTVVCALGYEAVANARGGYPNGYYSVALDLNLTVGRGRDEAMTRRDVVELIVKAAETEVMSVEGVGKDENLYFGISEKDTALSVYHGINKLEARLTDDGITAISGRTNCPGNNVIIGTLRLKNENVRVDGLLGLRVIAYYNVNDEKLLYITEDEIRNSVLKINAENLVTDSPNSGNFKKNITYRENNRVQNAKINPLVDVIYNGSSYTNNFLESDLRIKAGSLTLIDTDLDLIYDIIVVEEFVNMDLAVNNQNAQTLSDNRGFVVDYTKYDKYEFFSAAGEVKTVSQMRVGNILSVYASKDNKRLKIIISDSKIEGRVVATSKDAYDRDVVTISHLVEGEETETDLCYSATFLENDAKNINGFKKASPNDEVTAKLDFEGKIAAFDSYKDTYQYAYFLRAGRDNSSRITIKTMIKVVLDTGDIADIPAAKKIVINGTANQTGQDILSVTDLYVDSDPAKDFRRQVIKIKLNALGELKEIITTNDNDCLQWIANDAPDTEKYKKAVGFDLEKFRLVWTSNTNTNGVITEKTASYYNAKRQSYDGSYRMDDTTTIFLIPSDANYDPEYIRVVKAPDLYDYARIAKVRMYDSDEHWTVGAAEITQVQNEGYLPQSMVVTKVAKSTDANGNEIYMITGWYKSTVYTFREERPGIIDAAFNRAMNDSAYAQDRPYMGNLQNGLEFGDIIDIKIDNDMNIIDAEIRVKTNSAPSGRTNATSSNENTGYAFYWGYVYAKSDSTVTLALHNSDGSLLSVRGHAIANGSKPVILNYNTKEVKVGDWSDIPVSATVGENGVFTFTDTGTMLFTYRESGYMVQTVLVIK